jgi:hypothetical protein
MLLDTAATRKTGKAFGFFFFKIAIYEPPMIK